MFHLSIPVLLPARQVSDQATCQQFVSSYLYGHIISLVIICIHRDTHSDDKDTNIWEIKQGNMPIIQIPGHYHLRSYYGYWQLVDDNNVVTTVENVTTVCILS